MKAGGTVPCNGCTRCCRGDAVRILPHEDANQWQTESHPAMSGARMLAHKPNGDCIYVTDAGCSIHGRTPQQCREMDCRNLASALTWTQARKLNRDGLLSIAVWRKGKDLLNEAERRI